MYKKKNSYKTKQVIRILTKPKYINAPTTKRRIGERRWVKPNKHQGNAIKENEDKKDTESHRP